METKAQLTDGSEAVVTKDLLIYAGRGSEYGQSLSRRIQTTVNPSAWITDDLSVLTKKLAKPKLRSLIAVLVASSDEDLSALLELKDWFEGIKVILILPTESWGWIDQAHWLRPRFLGFTDEDQGRITQVLEKMLSAEYP
jgi:hypothetical protein